MDAQTPNMRRTGVNAFVMATKDMELLQESGAEVKDQSSYRTAEQAHLFLIFFSALSAVYQTCCFRSNIRFSSPGGRNDPDPVYASCVCSGVQNIR